jgi:hypothetical protein
MKKLKSILFILLILSFNIGLCDELTWTGTGGNNEWDNPNNWDGGKVPTRQDNVTIPANTPDCNVEYAYANNLSNHGTIISDALLGLNIESGGNFNNHGTINSDKQVDIKATRIYNNPSGTIQGKDPSGIGTAVDLWAGQEIKNWGDISSLSSGGQNEFGGNILIVTSCSNGTEKVSNLGQITAADGTQAADGGNITIASGTLRNTGTIISGNAGEYSDCAGKVTIIVGKLDNEGTIKGGSSDSKGTGGVSGHNNVSRDIIMGDVNLYADSIFLHQDTNFVEGRILSLYCHYLNISDVNNYAGIWTTEGVHVYATADGTADFSGVDQVSAIRSENDDGNHIYANNIIEPAQGLAYIFSPDPAVHPSDTTIIGGYISGKGEFNNPGMTDTLPAYMQNLSMLPKVLSYSISSDLGWIETVSANSPQLEPFEFYSIELQYSIPSGTVNGTADTVEMIITIDGVFADTSYCIIECVEEGPIGIPENAFNNNTILYQNFPNPFSQNTTIAYLLNEEAKVTLELYDHSGKRISMLVDKFQAKGYHKVNLNRNNLGNGVYYYVLKQNGNVTNGKSLVIMP